MPDEAATERRADPDRSDGATVITSLIESVASARDVDPLELPPLQETIDTEALESLLRSRGADGGVVEVTFDYAGFRIGVDSDGTIRLREYLHRRTDD